MPKVYLRLNGSGSGCVAKLPESFEELLRAADAKLLGGAGTAQRIFAEKGDELLPEDFELVEADDVLYVSTGDNWIAPPAAPAASPAKEAPAAAVPEGAPGTESAQSAGQEVGVASGEPMAIDDATDGAAAPGAEAAASVDADGLDPEAAAEGEEKDENEPEEDIPEEKEESELSWYDEMVNEVEELFYPEVEEKEEIEE